MASLMTSEHGDIDRIAIEVEECKRLGIHVLPPDVNESYSTFTAVFNTDTKKPVGKIRFGLSAIKNVGDNVISYIVHERKEHGPYTSLEDFIRRIRTRDLNKKSFESLIKSGALDALGERNQMLDNLDIISSLAKSAEREGQTGQTNLFGSLPVEHMPELKLRPCPPAEKKQKLAWEKELLGLYISEHPLEEFRDQLSEQATPIADIGRYINQSVRIIGVVSQIQKILTRAGEPMLFVRLEDLTGRIETLVFPSVLKVQPALWQSDAVVMVNGRVSDKDGVPKVLVSDAHTFTPGEKKVTEPTGPFLITLPSGNDTRKLDLLKEVLMRFPGPHRVHLKISSGGKTRTVATKYSVQPTADFQKAVDDLLAK